MLLSFVTSHWRMSHTAVGEETIKKKKINPASLRHAMTRELCHSKSNYISVARPHSPPSLPLANAILPQQYGKMHLTAT